MKKITKVFLVVLMMVAVACNESRKDDRAYSDESSRERADEANAERFEGETEDDADWVAKAAEKNYGEIRLATLATEQSQNAEVQRIAQMLVEHHTKTLDELKLLAQRKGITIPTAPPASVERQADRFTDEAGQDFDKKWCSEMIDMHEESIRDFEKRAENTEDAEVKAFANKTLPTLRTHLSQLEACEQKLDDSNS